MVHEKKFPKMKLSASELLKLNEKQMTKEKKLPEAIFRITETFKYPIIFTNKGHHSHNL